MSKEFGLDWKKYDTNRIHDMMMVIAEINRIKAKEEQNKYYKNLSY